MAQLRSVRTCSLFAALAIGLLPGCGADRSPVAPGAPLAKRIMTNGYAKDVATTAASVVISEDRRTASGVLCPEGGSLSVRDDNCGGHKDDLEVALTIPAGVLTEALTITMTVTGDRYEDLIVSFSPAFVFAASVDMRIDLGADLVCNKEIKGMTPYHLYADGTTEPVAFYHIDRSAATFNFFIKVPGFSRYGLTRL